MDVENPAESFDHRRRILCLLVAAVQAADLIVPTQTPAPFTGSVVSDVPHTELTGNDAFVVRNVLGFVTLGAFHCA